MKNNKDVELGTVNCNTISTYSGASIGTNLFVGGDITTEGKLYLNDFSIDSIGMALYDVYSWTKASPWATHNCGDLYLPKGRPISVSLIFEFKIGSALCSAFCTPFEYFSDGKNCTMVKGLLNVSEWTKVVNDPFTASVVQMAAYGSLGTAAGSTASTASPFQPPELSFKPKGTVNCTLTLSPTVYATYASGTKAEVYVRFYVR